MQKKPSEQINDFLEFLEKAKEEYESAFEKVGEEDRKVQTFLHDTEFAPDRNERNKVATRLQRSRRKRREAKDIVQLYENVYKFYLDRSNQNFIKSLRKLFNDQRMMENYLFGKREFKKRVD